MGKQVLLILFILSLLFPRSNNIEIPEHFISPTEEILTTDDSIQVLTLASSIAGVSVVGGNAGN